jgi:hypothetical protein
MNKISRPSLFKSIDRWHLVLAAFFFMGFTIVMTWPLTLKMGAYVIGPKGDNFYYVWLIGWFQRSIFELRQNPLVVAYQNYPFGWNLAYTEISLANVLFALPFSILKGPVFAYNFTLLASFVLSGLIVYWWVLAITGNKFAGLIAGALFAYAPYRMTHVYGHLPLMGTSVHWLGKRVMIQTPSFLKFWTQATQTFIPTLGYILYKKLPYYDGMRAWMRYGILVMLFFSVLAGIGFAALSSRLGRRAYSWSAAFLALVWIGIEFLPSFQFSSTQFRPVDTWLSTQAGTGSVAQFPVFRMLNGDVIYGTLAYRKPYLGMFMGAFLPTNFTDIQPLLDKFPDEESVRLLRQRDVQYVIVDSAMYKDWQGVQKQILDLGLLERGIFNRDYAYELPPGP